MKILIIISIMFLMACDAGIKVALPFTVTAVKTDKFKGCQLFIGNPYSGEIMHTTYTQENCNYVVGQVIK